MTDYYITILYKLSNIFIILYFLKSKFILEFEENNKTIRCCDKQKLFWHGYFSWVKNGQNQTPSNRSFEHRLTILNNFCRMIKNILLLDNHSICGCLLTTIRAEYQSNKNLLRITFSDYTCILCCLFSVRCFCIDFME